MNKKTKGFFKRGLNKYVGFICINGNDCTINKITRNRCKACRFKRCLRKGMSIDGIKMGRISKNTKQKVLIGNKNNHDKDESDEEENISAIKLNGIYSLFF